MIFRLWYLLLPLRFNIFFFVVGELLLGEDDDDDDQMMILVYYCLCRIFCIAPWKKSICEFRLEDDYTCQLSDASSRDAW